MPVGPAVPEAGDPGLHPLAPDQLGERDSADVRRAREDLGDRHALCRARLMLVDDPVGDPNRRVQDEWVVGETSFSESAAATVTTLKVEPGS